ncbi:MAG: DUF1615 family protein [Archangium sp.]|nr:DUF1615 family protein [Archangium sp.]
MRSMRWVLLVCVVTTGCVHTARPDVRPELSVAQVVPLFPQKVHDADGWARDLVLALQTNRLPVDVQHVCSVIAVAEQESGLQANPAVAGLPAIARSSLAEKAKALGPLGPPLLAKLLEGTAPGTSTTFDQRIDTLRTEADLDLLFRDILADHQRRSPVLYAAANVGATLFSSGSFEDRNPVTTAGSMQVSVRFAEAHARQLRRDVERVRDELYTRAGGLLYGSARLWAFEAGYASMRFRFADYNAGPFASRNAAFQEQLGALTHTTLALDGDLLAYDPDGDVKSTETKSMAALQQFRDDFAATLLRPGQVERDAKKEKTEAFEHTQTWAVVKAAYSAKFKPDAAYARLPVVSLTSPKLKRPMSTATFAESVERRYTSCLRRAGADAPSS